MSDQDIHTRPTAEIDTRSVAILTDLIQSNHRETKEAIRVIREESARRGAETKEALETLARADHRLFEAHSQLETKVDGKLEALADRVKKLEDDRTSMQTTVREGFAENRRSVDELKETFKSTEKAMVVHVEQMQSTLTSAAEAEAIARLEWSNKMAEVARNVDAKQIAKVVLYSMGAGAFVVGTIVAIVKSVILPLMGH
ncbi:hypothetical protein AKJ09_09866 [Labilithrix luteola]|uniref:Uncharacterized protein n=1 Tax=Labilithrix luteola TaxID=1391654 RepID=A0A0K1QBV6_9BACT|nr:hypothetical protein [Labilithrix luteola]AKV03203.1 hypothetical protein AKJ09_09866 [Labilithrix luteola]